MRIIKCYLKRTYGIETLRYISPISEQIERFSFLCLETKNKLLDFGMPYVKKKA